MKRKVVHIITGLGNGGAEGILFQLCVRDAAHTHFVVTLTDEGKYGEKFRSHGIVVYQLKIKKGLGAITGFFRLYTLIRKEKPDIVQTWMYHSNLLGGLAAFFALNRNINWGIHNSSLDSRTTSLMTRGVVIFLSPLSYIIPKSIIFCSQRSLVIHREIFYNSSKLKFIPNGYDTDMFSPDTRSRQALRDALGLTMDLAVLGVVARYHSQKDHKNFFRAVEILRKLGVKFRVLCVGDGLVADNSRLGALLDQFGIRDLVELLGPSSDIPAVMNALDILVLPSAFGEAFPNVVAEAMACGTPCIVTDVGDSGFIAGESGWVVPPRDPYALALNILTALRANSQEFQYRKAIARSRIVQNFSLEKMIAGYSNVWSE